MRLVVAVLLLFGYYDRGLKKAWRRRARSQVVAAGSVKVTRRLVQEERTEDIPETDFDRYVKVCINGGHRLYARGGILYCTVTTRPGIVRITARLTGPRSVKFRLPAPVRIDSDGGLVFP